MMYGKRENCSLQENGSLKGKTGYMEKTVNRSCQYQFTETFVNKTILHTKFLYMIYKTCTHEQRFYHQHQAKIG